jgi:hypothetical protein
MARAHIIVVFINGLELGEPGILEWQEARAAVIAGEKSTDANSKSAATQKPTDGFAYTNRRSDRLDGEHGLVPGLKVSTLRKAPTT